MVSEMRVFTIGFVIFVLLVLVVGCGLSGNFSDTDLFNPLRNGATAEDMLADTDWKNEIREIDKPFLKDERAAEHKAYMEQRENDAKIAAEQAEQQVWTIEQIAKNNVAQQARSAELEAMEKEQKIRNRGMLVEALILILKVFGIVAAIGVGVFVTFLAIRKYLPQQATSAVAPAAEISAKPFAQTWDKPNYRQDRISQARRMEGEIRKLQLQGKQPSNVRREVYPWRT